MAMGQVPALYRVVDKMATSVSRAEWTAVRVKGKTEGRPDTAKRRAWVRKLGNVENPRARRKLLTKGLSDGQLEVVENHPFLEMWERGTPDFDATTTIYLIEAYLLLVGAVYIGINRGRSTGKPISIQPFSPEMLSGTSTQTHTIFSDGKRQFEYPVKDVFVIRKPHPLAPYSDSLGMAQVLVGELDIDKNAQDATASRFRNGMVPDLLVKVRGAEGDALDRVEKKFEDRNQGPLTVGRAIFTGADDIDIQPISSSLVDMDVINVRTHQADAIRETPGIPPEIFGHVTNSNRATIAAADYLYALHVIDPELHFLMRAINHHMAGAFGDGVFLMYDSPIPADRDFQLDVTREHPGSFSENEVRNLASHPEREGGDIIRGTSYTSGQIEQVPNIVTLVATGQISRESGKAILISMFGIEPEQAEQILGPVGFEAAIQPAGVAATVDPKQDDDEDEGEGDEEAAPSGDS